ncbi:pentapeptide repeat-containing protein [Tychonema sp. LEGE 07203]|uniref:pentapeptide repeat-containing protein n=1 Tax=Tychonema sp. LEGE 07203 TaxID=1828671 RepID=UPI001882CD3F|nr:pentapeptide repeat-containing protein [Tychonema sp. LEGE 07203]MBE9092426.1 pentapeptide repeat-containing protein [Tychonema sp. LEGE 07203]
MTLINRKQISLYEEAEAGLNSLVKQIVQVGTGFLMMLLLTGGNPPAFTVGLSVVGGIAFVAWSEEKRLTKFYGRQSQIPNSPESTSRVSIENYIEQILEANTNNLYELVKQAGLNPYEDLAGCNLSSVKGIGCKLSRFDLSGADLAQADLSRADLSFANLRNARLINVKLCRADLNGADLRSALLMDANLSFADLSNANLSDADLINANLTAANLSNANLHQANLTSTNLNNAKVKNAQFGKNAGLDEKAKYELKMRGAIFPQDELIPAQV